LPNRWGITYIKSRKLLPVTSTRLAVFYLEYLIVKDVTTPQTQLNTKTNTGVKTPRSMPATPLLAL